MAPTQGYLNADCKKEGGPILSLLAQSRKQRASEWDGQELVEAAMEYMAEA